MNCKKRIYNIFTIFLFLFIILIGKVSFYQYFDSKNLSVIAQNQYEYEEKAQELKYSILDCNGKELLKYFYNYYVVIDPFSFKLNDYYTKKDEMYALSIILKNYNEDYNLDNVDLKDKIRWKIDEATYNKLCKIKGVKGFYIYKYKKVDKRNGVWNVENLLINNIKVNSKGVNENKSKDSLEGKINEKTDKNKYVYNIFKKDVNGNIYDEYYTEPKDNINVRLTLDKYLQENIKEILNKKPYNEYEQTGVILMESDTGKIKAMVQKDDFKPNVNLGISTNHGFFPGSIFKIIVEEAGLESGKITLDKKYVLNPNLDLRYKGHEKTTVLNPSEALIQSSNDIYAQIGIDTGIKNIKSFSKEQGLMSKVLNFDEETYGIFEGNDNEAGDVELTSFGQKQRITPIEAISIPNTVINEGVYVKPHIVEAYVDKNNIPIEKITEENKKIFSKETASAIKKQMRKVVTSENGTGSKAYIENIYTGGKTGTAEREEGENKFFDGWFVGFFTIGEKKYSMVVFVKNIGDNSGGGSTAAPIFRDIVKKTYDYLIKF